MYIAVIVVLLITIIAALGLYGGYRMLRYFRRYEVLWAPNLNVSDAFDALKTGDLVLFTAATHLPTNSIFTQQFYSHGGVVVREGGRLFISESTRGIQYAPGLHAPSGASLNPLLTRIKHYNGVCHLVRLARPLSAGAEAAVRAAAREWRPYPGARELLVGGESRHCFQHVAGLLDRAGVTDGLADSGPIAVCRRVCALPAERPDLYAPPRRLQYDITEKYTPDAS